MPSRSISKLRFSSLFSPSLSISIVERGPSILTGFQTVSRLHQLLRELLEAYRQDKRYPPTEYAHTQSSLRYITSSLGRCRQILEAMPEELKTPSMVPAFRPSAPLRNITSFPDITLSTGFVPAATGGGNYGFRPFSGFFSDLFSDENANGNGNGYSGHQQFQPQNQETPPSFATGTQIWPSNMFDTNGLPNADAKSNSSAQPSPRSSIAHMSQLSTPTHVHSQNPVQNSSSNSNGNGVNPFPVFQSQYSPELPHAPLPTHQTPAPSIQQLNAAVNRVENFIQSPPPMLSSQPPLLSPWATMRANILVTEAMIRFVLVEYRDLVDGLLSKQGGGHEAMMNPDHSADEEWEAAAKNMLDVFNG